MVADRAHDRAEPRDDARPQVVAVGEPARQDHGVRTVQIRVLVPQRDRLRAGQLDTVERIAIAVRARKDDDPAPHATAPPFAGSPAASASTDQDSISGLANSSEASRS